MQSLTTFAALLLASVLFVPLFKRAGLGTVLGYLAVGMLIGPFGIKLVRDPDNLMHTAELGVILLLFVIGLELKPSRLWALRRSVFGLGVLQLAGAASRWRRPGATLGFRCRRRRWWGSSWPCRPRPSCCPRSPSGELSTRHGREAFAILLFQDLSVIPLLALIPLFGTGKPTALTHPAVGLGLLVVVALIGRPLLDALFRHVARVNSREMFTAAALVTVLGLALMMQAGGLSMSLGAFVAGVLLADSEFRHELEASIAPFQGLLLGLFFMAVGMSTNLSLLVKFPWQILGLTVGLIVVKFVMLYGLRRLIGGQKADARLLALALAQGGEFAFVLFDAAQSFRVLGEVQADKLTLVVALSMALSPLLLMLGDRLARAEAEAQPPRAFDTMPAEAGEVVIAGFGRVGQIVGRLLLARGVPFTALDADPEQVDAVRKFGLKVFYGDAANLDLLHAAQLREAKVFVLAIDDVEASLRTAELVRRHFPHVQIVARARNRFHASRLMDLGIQRQIRETLPASFEMARWTLELLHEPPALAEQLVSRFARHDAELLARQQAIAHDESSSSSRPGSHGTSWRRSSRKPARPLPARSGAPSGRFKGGAQLPQASRAERRLSPDSPVARPSISAMRALGGGRSPAVSQPSPLSSALASGATQPARGCRARSPRRAGGPPAGPAARPSARCRGRTGPAPGRGRRRRRWRRSGRPARRHSRAGCPPAELRHRQPGKAAVGPGGLPRLGGFEGVQPAAASLDDPAGAEGRAVHHHQHALVAGLGAGGEAHRGQQVGGAVGRRVVGRAHRAGEHHRLAGRQAQVQEPGGLFEGVGAVQDHHAVAGRIGDGRAGGGEDRQPVGRRHVLAVEGEDLPGRQRACIGKPGHSRDERLHRPHAGPVAAMASFRVSLAGNRSARGEEMDHGLGESEVRRAQCERMRARNWRARSERGAPKKASLLSSSTMRPWSMKITRLATFLAKPISWVTHIIVMPSWASSTITSSTSLIISGSRAEVGSSKSMQIGSIASARAIATRCCWPPESWPGNLSAWALRPTRSSSLRPLSIACSGCARAP
jgi:Kef-type K+ transport system membrane component KefB/voltage-gated potassium channel Kch